MPPNMGAAAFVKAEIHGMTYSEVITHAFIPAVISGDAERVELSLTVVGIADADAFTRDGAFVNLELMEAIENYRDGIAVTQFKWSGSEAPL